MNIRLALLLIVLLFNSLILNVADRSRRFERRYNISRLIFNVPGEEVCSLVNCGALCARSSSCKAFCYSQSTALCHLSQPYDPIVQLYDVSDSKCFNPTGCPMTKGYAWYGARCIKGYVEKNNYTDARAICTQDGGHLYHFKALEWDKQPIVDLRRDWVVNDQMWMGADDLEVQGQYKWSDSSVLADDSRVWHPNDPNDDFQSCVLLLKDNYMLVDQQCSRPSASVCQIDV